MVTLEPVLADEPPSLQFHDSKQCFGSAMTPILVSSHWMTLKVASLWLCTFPIIALGPKKLVGGVSKFCHNPKIILVFVSYESKIRSVFS